MSEKASTIGPLAAGAAMLGLCCGLPLLASVGAAGVVSGIGVGSWLIAGVASAVVVIGIVRWRQQRSICDVPASQHADARSSRPSATQGEHSSPIRVMPANRPSTEPGRRT